jgi:hypothetical protein
MTLSEPSDAEIGQAVADDSEAMAEVARQAVIAGDDGASRVEL